LLSKIERKNISMRKIVLYAATVALLISTALCVSAQRRQVILDRVVAVVGGSSILHSELTEYAEALVAQRRQMGYTSDRDPMHEALEALLEQKLLYNQAILDSVEISNNEVNSRIEAYLQQLVEEAGGIQALEIYKQLTEPNLFSSSPMLIDDYNPVGTTFVPEPYNSMTLSQLKKSGLDSEDYRYHQAYRHPRTAMCVTEDNDLLMITVDGRFSGKAEGMSAKELALFIQKHFNPRWAINMDGGGSTTMYIKGADTPCGVDGVVNHPCNSGSTWTKANLRNLNTFFLIKYNE
jgi:hypothetical protein